MASKKDPRIRQITIKTGVVKRYGKERLHYINEKAKEEEKAERMRQEGADEHDINKQMEVMRESQMMIPDCERRLKQSWGELETLLEEHKDLSETEEFKKAQEILEENRAVVA